MYHEIWESRFNQALNLGCLEGQVNFFANGAEEELGYPGKQFYAGNILETLFF